MTNLLFFLQLIKDPGLVIVAIVITGVEEAVIRCTMVQRDRWATETDASNPEKLKMRRKIWAASSGLSMMNEITAILICRTTVILLRPHRYIFAVGEDGSDLPMLLFGMLLELMMEACVDFAAIQVEKRHGVDLEEFWTMFRENPSGFLGCNA